MIPEQISAQLALPLTFIQKVARTASFRYKRYTIPKRTGGEREIHHPARELKLLQNWLLNNMLNKLPVHSAATAYGKGCSIRKNAELHVANNYLLRVDFQNFFPSLKGSDVVCRFNELTIGAPTSPKLSNAIMFDFDAIWSHQAKIFDVTYTRYADDLYFSTNRPDILRGILNEVRKSLISIRTPTLTINQKKTAFSSRKRRRLTAGLVLTSDKKISIGRKKKRMLKSLVLKLQHKELNPEQIASLRGWVSHLRSVEPQFVLALQRKYNLVFDDPATWEI